MHVKPVRQNEKHSGDVVTDDLARRRLTFDSALAPVVENTGRHLPNYHAVEKDAAWLPLTPKQPLASTPRHPIWAVSGAIWRDFLADLVYLGDRSRTQGSFKPCILSK
jgi:hypothetical protein